MVRLQKLKWGVILANKMMIVFTHIEMQRKQTEMIVDSHPMMYLYYISNFNMPMCVCHLSLKVILHVIFIFQAICLQQSMSSFLCTDKNISR